MLLRGSLIRAFTEKLKPRRCLKRTIQTKSTTEMTEKFKVLFCTDNFPKAIQWTKEQLQSDPSIEISSCKREEVMETIEEAVVAIPFMTPFTASILAKAERLKLIIQYGVGLEGVDIEEASRLGIWVSNIPSSDTANALSCAEHAIYLILALLRDQNEMQNSIQQRRIGFPVGEMLHEKRVLVIGFGGIVKKLIPLLKAFEAHVTAVRQQPWTSLTPSQTFAAQMLDVKCHPRQLPSILPEMDIVVVACVQNAATRGMINDAFLSHCKSRFSLKDGPLTFLRDGVKIVNVSRGGVLDEGAILDGLKRGKIGGLGLDVQWNEPFDPNHEILNYNNVILTPHIAGVTQQSYQDMARIIAKEVQKIKAGEPPTRIVNQAQLKHL